MNDPTSYLEWEMRHERTERIEKPRTVVFSGSGGEYLLFARDDPDRMWLSAENPVTLREWA